MSVLSLFEQFSTAASRYFPTTVKGWLQILNPDGSAIEELMQIPISGMVLRFPVMGIPTAEFIFATGRDAVTRRVSDAHTVLERLQNQVRVKAYLQLDGRERPDRRWTKGAFLVWDGVTTGPSFRRNRQTNTASLQSAHWLLDLDAATTVSSDLIRNSADNLLVNYGLDAGNGKKVAALEAQLVGGLPATGDFWKQVLLPMFKRLMLPTDQGGKLGTQMWAQTVTALGRCSNPDANLPKPKLEAGNTAAVKILEERFNQARKLIPGALQFDSALQGPGLRRQLALILASRVGQCTCLEKLISACSLLTAKLIPTVESATLVQHTPVLDRNLYWRTIYPSEYFDFSSTHYTPRQLAGVGLVGTNVYQDAHGQQAINGRIAGAFRATEDGQFFLANAPPWLLFQASPAVFHGLHTKVRTALSTDDKQDHEDIRKAEKEKQQELSEMGCRLSQTIWHDEVYRGRTAELVGRLRFDVAPGSILRVLTRGPLEAGAQRNGAFWGSVNQVTVVLDADNRKAFTSFQLGHVRTPTKDELAPNGHPLFSSEAWLGSPLVPLTSVDLKPESDDI